MADTTAISWTDHTFNPWQGCERVSPGCDNCYADAISRRVGHANPSITLRVYSHFYKQDALNVGYLLDNAIKCGQNVVKTPDST